MHTALKIGVSFFALLQRDIKKRETDQFSQIVDKNLSRQASIRQRVRSKPTRDDSFEHQLNRVASQIIGIGGALGTQKQFGVRQFRFSQFDQASLADLSHGS